jgi:hypothetical protein
LIAIYSTSLCMAFVGWRREETALGAFIALSPPNLSSIS